MSGRGLAANLAWVALAAAVPQACQWVRVSDQLLYRCDDQADCLPGEECSGDGYCHAKQEADAGQDASDGGEEDAGEDAGVVPGLVGFWRFEEDGGTTARDSSIKGNHGTLVKGPTWEPSGKVGGALSLDGVDDAVVVDAGSLDTLGEAFSVVAWVYGSDRDDGIDDDRNILGKGDRGAGRMNTLVFGVDYAKQLTLAIANGTKNQTCTGTTPLESSRWYLVVGTFDGGQPVLYLDGARDSTDETRCPPWTGGRLIEAGDLVIGRQSEADCKAPYSSCWQGLLDEVRVYDRALVDDEVRALFHGGM